MRILSLMFAAVVVFVSGASAAPCYGPRMPGRNRFAAGAQTYMLFNRDLEKDYGTMRSTQHFLLVSYGIFDWFSLDLKGGAGNIKQRPVTRDEIDYRSNFAGGYGLRLRVYGDERNKVVFGFQHISVHPRTSETTEPNRAILDDWQASLLASRDFGRVAAYLGTRLSRVDYIHRVHGNRKRVMSVISRDVGLITGCDIELNDSAWINLEGQFIDAQAAAVSFNHAF